jgi:predicted amidophosphoribosyltransferase
MVLSVGLVRAGAEVAEAAVELLLDGRCAGCGRPGRGVCPPCRRAVEAGRVAPRVRAGIATPLWSAGDYVEPLPDLIAQAKDHARWPVITLLGARLALAVAGLADQVGATGPGLLVPFPSQPAVVRRRGLDFTRALAEAAAAWLGRVGLAARVHRGLRHARVVRDQSHLTTEDRQANLAGSLVAGPLPAAGWLFVVDDVVTTGASLREAVRALAQAGRPADGLATVAATVLRSASRTGD